MTLFSRSFMRAFAPSALTLLWLVSMAGCSSSGSQPGGGESGYATGGTTTGTGGGTSTGGIGAPVGTGGSTPGTGGGAAAGRSGSGGNGTAGSVGTGTGGAPAPAAPLHRRHRHRRQRRLRGLGRRSRRDRRQRHRRRRRQRFRFRRELGWRRRRRRQHAEHRLRKDTHAAERDDRYHLQQRLAEVHSRCPTTTTPATRIGWSWRTAWGPGHRPPRSCSANYFTFATQDSKNTIFAAPRRCGRGGVLEQRGRSAHRRDPRAAGRRSLHRQVPRVFATGFSFGGGMAMALACTRADVFRAVAFFSGADLTNSCPTSLTRPIAYYASQASEDRH